MTDLAKWIRRLFWRLKKHPHLWQNIEQHEDSPVRCELCGKIEDWSGPWI